jgi:diguanylate cyclase (GGDEF)-like protein
VSFGRRLALFFLLLVLVPTLALIAVLFAVSQDSRRGKADARLAAGLDTAAALYAERVTVADAAARKLARDPQLSAALTSLDRSSLEAFAERAARLPDVVDIELDAADGSLLAAAGSDNGFAEAELGLRRVASEVGMLRVASTTAADYVAELHRLTGREVVVSRDGVPLSSTVTPPNEEIEPGETVDLELDQRELRARLLTLDSAVNESVLLAGPRTEGGFLSIGWPAILLLTGFLLLAGLLAYGLSRALTWRYSRVAQEAATDPLTGLWNRRRLSEMLAREVDRALRFDHPLSFLIFDVDDFKAINDREGHPQGDAVLRAVAEVVLETTRSIDVAARYGGDEFALILLETDFDGAAMLAERLRTGFKNAEIPRDGGPPMKATISVGVATLPDAAVDVKALVDAADRALLRAKRAGKNKIRTAPPRTAGGRVRRASGRPGGRPRNSAPS